MAEAYRVLVTCDLGEEALAKFSEEPGFTLRVEKIQDEVAAKMLEAQ